jgi:hypothetical protein
MSLKYGALCFVLFLVVLFLAVKSYDALTRPLGRIPDKGAANRSETKADSLPGAAVAKEPGPIVSYTSIAEKNIFNPERKDFPVTASGAGMKPAVRPQVILYGVTLAGDYQSASVVNPGRPLKKGERELMTVRIGDRVGEYKLANVSSDRITLEAQGDTFEVLLYDPKMPKKRVDVKTESKPAMVTSAQAPPTGASDLKREGGFPGAPSSPFPPMGTPRPPARRDATDAMKESGREKPSPSQMPEPVIPSVTPSTSPGPLPTPIPRSAPTPSPLPGTMTPPMTPTPITPPPGTGLPVPSLSGTPTQPQPGGGR